MLLRWFVNLYNLEVVEEEAFLKWKEDITDDYPGKGKALFQVSVTVQIRHTSLGENSTVTGTFSSVLLNLLL